MSSIDSYRHRLIAWFECPSDYDLVAGNATRSLPIYLLEQDIPEDEEDFDGKAGDLLLGGGSGEAEAMRISLPKAKRFFEEEGFDDFESYDELFNPFWSPSFAYKLGDGCRKLGWDPEEDLEMWLARAVLKLVAEALTPPVKEGVIPIPLSDLVDAYERISNTRNFECPTNAMICPALGRVLMNQGPDFNEIEEMEAAYEESEDGPDPFEGSLNFPDRQDLSLGWELCVDFAAEHFPTKAEEVRDYFRRKGGYRRFNDLVYRQNLQKVWMSFETERIRQALLKWCRRHEIAVDPEG
ncbi:MAG: hypothetical protein RL095_1278 [Verrucomicrobiota bacterium]|jgi:hypothetical protein